MLIVDDEAEFLTMASETLRTEGYRTLVAGTAGAAIELFAERGHEIDLVLLDILMPEMDGGAVFRAIKGMSRDAKIVLCSGFSAEGQVGELLDAGVDGFIQKPFVFQDLDKVISRVLNI